MRRHEITDEHWERIKDFLPGQAGDPGVTAKDNRLFVNAVLWIAKTGAPWRDLPERFGPWGSVWKRFDRWAHEGGLEAGLRGAAGPRPGVDDPRQHRGPGAPACRRGRKRGQATIRPWAAPGADSAPRSTSLVDALGNPVEFVLTAGQEADVTQAEPLMRGA